MKNVLSPVADCTMVIGMSDDTKLPMSAEMEHTIIVLKDIVKHVE